VASGWMAVQRFSWNMGWSKIGLSKNGNYGKFMLFGPIPAFYFVPNLNTTIALIYTYLFAI